MKDTGILRFYYDFPQNLQLNEKNTFSTQFIKSRYKPVLPGIKGVYNVPT